jgi:hypothetical protein
MSLWGTWKCPACGNEWTGGIGWDLSICGDKPRLERTLKAICGCTDAEITEEEAAKMKLVSRMGGKVGKGFPGRSLTDKEDK